MSLLSNLKAVENKFAWSFLGVIVTIIVFIVTTYLGEKKDNFGLMLTIDNEVDLVEVKEQVQDLKILYQDKDILKTNQRIKMIICSFRNDGKTILQSYYDIEKPFGLSFKNSKIIGYKVLNSNSEYLKNSIKPTQKNDGEIQLSKVIFESGKFVSIKIFLMQPKSVDRTTISVFGKIAGTDSIEVKYPEQKQIIGNYPSPLPWVVILAIGVFIGFILLTLVAVIAMVLTENKSRKKITQIVRDERDDLTAEQLKILDDYENQWSIVKFNQIIRSLGKNQYVLDLREYVERKFRPFEHLPYPLSQLALLIYPGPMKQDFILALPKSIFSYNGAQITLNPQNESFLIYFFEKVGLFPKQKKLTI